MTFIGRVKENTTNLRRYHAAMAHEWDEAMKPDSSYIFALSGDLKYMLTMLGHAGASATYPCPCCVRSRRTLCYRAWIPEELQTMQALEPATFCGASQLRSFPANPNCKHDVESGNCFCVDKGAAYIQEHIETVYGEHTADFKATDQLAPWHKDVMKLTRDKTYSIVAHPLLSQIPLSMRLPGIWHCCHNTRQMLWIMIKDAAAVYGVIPELEAAMKDISLEHIKIAAVGKPRKEANMEAMISEENAAAQERAVDEEAKNDCVKRAGMDGKEVTVVMSNFDVILDHFERGVKPAMLNQLHRWG